MKSPPVEHPAAKHNRLRHEQLFVARQSLFARCAHAVLPHLIATHFGIGKRITQRWVAGSRDPPEGVWRDMLDLLPRNSNLRNQIRLHLEGDDDAAANNQESIP